MDGLPIRKRERGSLAALPRTESDAPEVAPRERDVREHLSFNTPISPDAPLEHSESPLSRLAQVTQHTLLQAAAQETSPAVIKVLQCVSEQCSDAIQAAKQQQAGAGDVAAVEQEAVDRVLQQHERLQQAQAQLLQQEKQMQSLTDDLISLEQITQSAGQQISADAIDGNNHNDQKPEAALQVCTKSEFASVHML